MKMARSSGDFCKKFPQIPLSTIHRFLRQKKVRVVRGERKSHGKGDENLRKRG